MARDRITTQYKVTTVYGDDKPMVASNTVIHVDRVKVTQRVSTSGTNIGYPTREVEATFKVTPAQAAELIARLSETLSWMAADSIRWAEQLEAADIKPAEL